MERPPVAQLGIIVIFESDDPFVRRRFSGPLAERLLYLADRTKINVDIDQLFDTPHAGCEWASMNPGVTAMPLASITSVPAAMRRRISSVLPTAVKRRFFTAKASACGEAPTHAALRDKNSARVYFAIGPPRDIKCSSLAAAAEPM